MFTWTPEAAALIKSLMADGQWPDDSGLRLSTSRRHQSLWMGLAAWPEPRDATLSEHGTQIFVHPSAAERLDGLTLHADITGPAPRFFLSESPARGQHRKRHIPRTSPEMPISMP